MPAVVIMGPSGCGKTTLGKALAAQLDWTFVEGDALHPPGNIDKMAAGIPLTDADRHPFLENVAAALAANHHTGVVAACSALKRVYRDLIRGHCPGVLFVLPPVDRAQLLENMAARAGHFMPPGLIDSQLADLEVPDADETALDLAGVATLEAALERISARLDGAAAG